MLSYGDPVRLLRHGAPTHHYFSRLYDPDTGLRSWKSTGCTSLKTAKEWVNARRSEVAMGKTQAAIATGQKLTFEEACLAWLKEKKATVSPAHHTTLQSTAMRFWIPYFGRKVIGDIAAQDLSAFLQKRKAGKFRASGKPLSAISVNQERSNFGTFFNWCRRQGWIPATPMEGVDRFSGVARRRTRYITREEEERLLGACREPSTIVVTAKRKFRLPDGKISKRKKTFEQSLLPPDYMYPLVLMAIRCGLRRGTLIALRWRNILFKSGQIEIEGEIMKSGEDYHAPLPASVLDTLRSYRDDLTRKWVEAGMNPIERVGPDAKVFGLGDCTRILKPFRAVARKAELSLTFHDLRRIFLNRCREAGVSIETAMRLSDHRTFETVRQHYREVRHEELVAAVRAVDGFAASPWTGASAGNGPDAQPDPPPGPAS